jgi:hypothetical protein
MGKMSVNISMFNRDAAVLLRAYPQLVLETPHGKTPFVHGVLQLKDQTESVISEYSIRIEPGPNYPKRFPWVYETAGRIPANVDWHVFEDNGNCCIASLPEETLICKKGISLASFVGYQVIPYFFNQLYRELNGFFLKERSHGNLGHLEFFMEVFKTKDMGVVVKLLKEALSRREAKCNSRCACGSQRKYRKCHRRAVRRIAALGNGELDMYLKMAIAYQTSAR